MIKSYMFLVVIVLANVSAGGCASNLFVKRDFTPYPLPFTSHPLDRKPKSEPVKIPTSVFIPEMQETQPVNAEPAKDAVPSSAIAEPAKDAASSPVNAEPAKDAVPSPVNAEPAKDAASSSAIVEPVKAETNPAPVNPMEKENQQESKANEVNSTK